MDDNTIENLRETNRNLRATNRNLREQAGAWETRANNLERLLGEKLKSLDASISDCANLRRELAEALALVPPAPGDPVEILVYSAPGEESRWSQPGVVVSPADVEVRVPLYGRLRVAVADQGKTWRKAKKSDTSSSGQHTQDSHCAGHLDADGTCAECGALHGPPCMYCCGRAFHTMTNCPGIHQYGTAEYAAALAAWEEARNRAK